MVSVEARWNQVPFFESLGMTRTGIEPRSSGPLGNTLLIKPMTRYKLQSLLWFLHNEQNKA